MMQQTGQATVGIVLAGGGSTRLAAVAGTTGGGKALITFQGRTFLEHVVAAVGTAAERTIVVAAPGQTLPAIEGACIVHDSLPGAGPLAGIRDGLRAALASHHDDRSAGADADGADAPPRFAFVASCDLPLLRPEMVRLLIDVAKESDALWTVPVVHGHRQVLVSVIRIDVLPQIEDWLVAGRRDLRGLFAEIARHDPERVCEVTEEACKAVDPMLVSFNDIDTPDDLRRLQSR
jgi:molybdopterin-guanine dinucleotide biosynthesis protein A